MVWAILSSLTESGWRTKAAAQNPNQTTFKDANHDGRSAAAIDYYESHEISWPFDYSNLWIKLLHN